jgi:hypothetical protein
MDDEYAKTVTLLTEGYLNHGIYVDGVEWIIRVRFPNSACRKAI